MNPCPECGGEIRLAPTIDGTPEYVCISCACVYERIIFQDSELRISSKIKKRKRYYPRSSTRLLDRVDPTWRYAIPRSKKGLYRKKYGYSNPILASLFRNPFVGVTVYKTRIRPIRSFRPNYESSYVDKRRRDKEIFEGRIRRLTRNALSLFDELTRKSIKRRRGLFAACLYVVALLECFEELKITLSPTEIIEEKTADGSIKRIFYISKKHKLSIRRRLCSPSAMKKWALCFKLSRKTIMKRIKEISQEIPEFGKIMAHVKFFLV